MVAENRGTHFTHDMFKGTEKHIQGIQKQKLDKKVKQYKQEHKEVTRSEWQKAYWRLVEESRRETEWVMNESKLYIYVANLLEMQVVDFDEIDRAIKEAESKGFSSTEAA